MMTSFSSVKRPPPSPEAHWRHLSPLTQWRECHSRHRVISLQSPQTMSMNIFSCLVVWELAKVVAKQPTHRNYLICFNKWILHLEDLIRLIWRGAWAWKLVKSLRQSNLEPYLTFTPIVPSLCPIQGPCETPRPISLMLTVSFSFVRS